MAKVLIAVGGSGGHLFPAQELRENLKGKADVLFAGHNLKKSAFLDRKYSFKEIQSAPFRKKNPFQFLWVLTKSFFQSLFLILNYSPDVVVGFGSYHSFPILLAARVLRKKIVLFEANTVPGKVNRFFGGLGALLAHQFPIESKIKRQTLVSSLPWGKKEIPTKEDAYRYFDLDPTLPVVLVFGGSQGAHTLNQIMPESLASIPCQVLHFTGGEEIEYQNKSVVKKFEKRMDLAYIASDVVVCRSGASTIAELLLYQKPALLIPFPFATDQHQLKNGQFLSEKVGGALLLEEKEMSSNEIRKKIQFLLENKEKLAQALSLWNANAKIDIQDLILDMTHAEK